MNTITSPNPVPPAVEPAASYDQLLSAAQAAQSAADRAVADLALVKRTLAEAPRLLKMRRDELDRAQRQLNAAETDYAAARDQVTNKQSEAARLIEAAADAQRALAHALISQDVMADSAVLTNDLSTRLAAANAQAKSFSPPPPAVTLGTNRYTPTPAKHPADVHSEVIDHLSQRDVFCPSCGHNLRGISTTQCPTCKLQLSINVLHSVRAHTWTATYSIWAVRGIALFSLLMSAYLTTVILSLTRPFGCGGGSGCANIVGSSWSKFLRIPVPMLSIPVQLAILASTLFLRVGLTDATRRRAWTALTFLGILSGLAGLWFIGIQLFVYKSICPHCFLVNVGSIITALIVLRSAPLGVPIRAPGLTSTHVEIPKRKAWILAGTTFGLFLIFAGIHLGMSRGSGSPVQTIAPVNEDDPKAKGLLFTPLETSKPAPKKIRLDPATSPSTDPSTGKENGSKLPDEPTGGLLLQGLDSGSK